MPRSAAALRAVDDAEAAAERCPTCGTVLGKGSAMVRVGDADLVLGRASAEMLKLLVRHQGRIVGAADLAEAGKIVPKSVPPMISRLKTQLAPLGLVVASVRGGGYVLGEGKRT